MNLNYYKFSYRLLWNRFGRFLYVGAEGIILLSSLASIFMIVYLFGFDHSQNRFELINATRNYLLTTFFVGLTARFFLRFKDIILERMIYLDVVIYTLLISVLVAQVFFRQEFADNFPYLSFFASHTIAYILLIFLSIVNLSRQVFSIIQTNISPTLLFMLSFAIVIFIGTGLLMLPNATTEPISAIDAFFTSASSVCVTGLSTIDQIKTFTPVGTTIILILIQIGGIGVMTFTTFFALSFMGSSSFNSQIMLKDMFNEERVNGLFVMIANIILVTFIVEVGGSYFIYQSVADVLPGDTYDKIYFSVFHSISAFCNAGISTIDGGLNNPLIANNISLHVAMSFIIVIGGLGFPIVFNYMRLLKHFLVNIFKMAFLGQKRYIHTPSIININTYIVITCTAVLIIGGGFLYFIAEYDNTLKDMSLGMKIAESLFGAVTPRTAGFTMYDIEDLTTSTLVLLMILMTIGGAPMSTAGGIKVTTVKVALQAGWGALLNRTKVNIRHREISNITIRKAFSTIVFYFLWIVLVVYLLTFTEKGVHIFTLMFEAFSALSTVGLSLDFTPHLSTAGKLLIILTMFIGRIGIMTFFMSFIKARKEKNYSYPQENILM